MQLIASLRLCLLTRGLPEVCVRAYDAEDDMPPPPLPIWFMQQRIQAVSQAFVVNAVRTIAELLQQMSSLSDLSRHTEWCRSMFACISQHASGLVLMCTTLQPFRNVSRPDTRIRCQCECAWKCNRHKSVVAEPSRCIEACT
jgi:hypothetical protein